MNCRFVACTLCTVLSMFVLLSRSQGNDDEKEAPVVVVVSPETKSDVQMLEEVEGKLRKDLKGWPVVLVRPVTGGQPWYSQQVVEDLDPDGGFLTEAFFGDDATPGGTRFRLVIVVVPDKTTAAEKYKQGSTHMSLGNLPRSEMIQVSRK